MAIRNEEEQKLLEQRDLLLFKEDLCEWLTNILDGTFIRKETFFTQLDTGVILCDLVTLIQTSYSRRVSVGENKGLPRISLDDMKCRRNAQDPLFHAYARDNIHNFIEWCKKADIGDAVRFETNGLVEHKDEKGVILCLMEVARIAGKVGLLMPELIKFEKEMESAEECPPAVDVCQTKPSFVSETNDDIDNNGIVEEQQARARVLPLDKEVVAILNQCSCKERIHIVSYGQGKFEVTQSAVPGKRGKNKKIIHARKLKDCIMVRVGGGWQSLELFLLRYDPCRLSVRTIK